MKRSFTTIANRTLADLKSKWITKYGTKFSDRYSVKPKELERRVQVSLMGSKHKAEANKIFTNAFMQNEPMSTALQNTELAKLLDTEPLTIEDFTAFTNDVLDWVIPDQASVVVTFDDKIIAAVANIIETKVSPKYDPMKIEVLDDDEKVVEEADLVPKGQLFDGALEGHLKFMPIGVMLSQVGMMDYVYNELNAEKSMHVFMLAASPEYQSLGLASLVFKAGEALGKEQGVTVTWAEATSNSRILNTRHGMKVAKDKIAYYDEFELEDNVEGKKLKPPVKPFLNKYTHPDFQERPDQQIKSVGVLGSYKILKSEDEDPEDVS